MLRIITLGLESFPHGIERRGNHRATIYLKSQYMQLEEKMSCMDQEKRVALIEKWKPRLESQFEACSKFLIFVSSTKIDDI